MYIMYDLEDQGDLNVLMLLFRRLYGSFNILNVTTIF